MKNNNKYFLLIVVLLFLLIVSDGLFYYKLNRIEKAFPLTISDKEKILENWTKSNISPEYTKKQLSEIYNLFDTFKKNTEADSSKTNIDEMTKILKDFELKNNI